jgi:ATP-dependent DNA ligase
MARIVPPGRNRMGPTPGDVPATHSRSATGRRVAGLRPREGLEQDGRMPLPVRPPVAPMLARAVDAVPAPDSVPGGLVYEPKWDGFRCIVFRDGDDVELASRGSKPLTRYFPEVVEAVKEHLPQRCVVDGELVVREGPVGSQRLNWEALAQRVHPAASRIRRLSVETPAEVVAFDVLALDDDDLMGEPFSTRRARLEEALAGLAPDAPVHLTRVTADDAQAREWFSTFEGAGLDGIVAKARDGRYTPGKRTMLKVKHSRTAEAVVVGYRRHTSGQGVGSLLLGLYDDDGQLRQIGGVSAFPMAARRAMVEALEPVVERDAAGEAVVEGGERSRFSAGRDPSWVRLRPELVVEISYDQMEGPRLRHAGQLLRWRPDRDPRSCTFDQLDRPVAYDLSQVLAT